MRRTKTHQVTAPFEVVSPRTGQPILTVLDDEHGAMLHLAGPTGNLAAVVGATAAGGYLLLFNAAGRQVASLQACEDEQGGGLALKDALGNVRAVVRAENEGARLELLDTDRMPLVTVAANEAGGLLQANSAVQAASVTVAATETGGSVTARGPSPAVGLALGADEGGGYLVNCDAEGKPRPDGVMGGLN